jgi:hypothetical protein
MEALSRGAGHTAAPTPRPVVAAWRPELPQSAAPAKSDAMVRGKRLPDTPERSINPGNTRWRPDAKLPLGGFDAPKPQRSSSGGGRGLVPLLWIGLIVAAVIVLATAAKKEAPPKAGSTEITKEAPSGVTSPAAPVPVVGPTVSLAR